MKSPPILTFATTCSYASFSPRSISILTSIVFLCIAFKRDDNTLHDGILLSLKDVTSLENIPIVEVFTNSDVPVHSFN